MSGWTALRLDLTSSLEDDILLALYEAGTVGVRIEGGEPPETGSPPAPVRAVRSAVAYFDRKANLEALLQSLGALGDDILLGVTEVEEEPWVERQERERAPLPIGRRFLILREPRVDADTASIERSRGVPSDWERTPAGSLAHDRITLVVPAKRAFGTGEHPTTRYCLELLEQVTVSGRRVLDFGAGSGILAMAAAALGASSVLGLDEDPEAIEIARENLELNGFTGSPGRVVRGRVELRTGDLSLVQGRYSLILANIYAGVLEPLGRPLAALQGKGDDLILSGFSPREASDISGVYGRLGYREAHRMESGEWAALLLQRRSFLAPRFG